MKAFFNGDGVIVTANGPGRLHLVSYGSNHKLPNHVGAVSTKPGVTGKTRFLISHSYTFTQFAFYWEGTGQAVCGVGQDMTRVEVGNSWNNAMVVGWGANSITKGDVTTYATTNMVSRDDQVTCFVIPDNVL